MVNATSSPMRAHKTTVAGLDDLQARIFAESLGLIVAGTLGVILKAKHAGLISTVKPLLDALIPQGFRIGPELYQDV